MLSGERPVLAHASHRASPSATPARAAAPIEIVNPPSGGVYLIDPTLRREFQTLPLRAATPQPTSIEWSVGGRVVGTTSSEESFSWPLTPGTHVIVARDARGRAAESSVTVK
jgi:membrane carboxypeptidase/penicillin-binding protein PbpC